MKRESLPEIQDMYRALEAAAQDLFGFAVVCHQGANWLAEPALLDVLLLGMENFWFSEREGNLSHKEYSEEFFRAIWHRAQGEKKSIQVGSDVPLGHDEMAFYELPQRARSALYLRSKKRFSFEFIASIMEIDRASVEEEVERAREFLLGKRIKPFEFASEEDF